MPSNINDFTLHGNWPSRNDTSWPSFCPGPSFSMSALDPIKTELETYWHSFGNTDQNFWSHEYEKHGTCASVVSKRILLNFYVYWEPFF
jgi:ribonuclease T2